MTVIGTFRTWRDVRSMSVERSEADMESIHRQAPTGLIPHPASPHTLYDTMATTQAGTRKDQG
jgi:hypothetical protein